MKTHGTKPDQLPLEETPDASTVAGEVPPPIDAHAEALAASKQAEKSVSGEAALARLAELQVPEIPEALERVMNLSEHAGVLMKSFGEGWKGQLQVARALKMMKESLTNEIMEEWIMPGQNLAAGFLTDKRDGGYPIEVVREIAIDSWLHGAWMVQNEVNIISAGTYYTVVFYGRTIWKADGFANLSIVPGIPEVAAGLMKTHIVPVRLDFTMHGIPYFLEGRYPIRANEGQMASSSVTKGKRAALKAAVGMLLGRKFTPLDSENQEGPRSLVDGRPEGSSPLLPGTGGVWPSNMVEAFIEGLEKKKIPDQEALAELKRQAGSDLTWEQAPVELYLPMRTWYVRHQGYSNHKNK